MPRHCVVPGCKSNYFSTSETVSTFRFPKNVEIRQKWINAIHRADWQPTGCSSVCRVHFCDKDFQSGRNNNKQPRLVYGAIPSIFPNLPQYLTVPETVIRKNPEILRENFNASIEAKSEEFIQADIICNFASNQVTLPNNKEDTEFEYIKSEIKDEEKEINNSSESSEYIKCGEVFLVNGEFKYKCSFCTDNFKNTKCFNEHIYSSHSFYVKFDEINTHNESIRITNNKIDQLIIEPLLSVDELANDGYLSSNSSTKKYESNTEISTNIDQNDHSLSDESEDKPLNKSTIKKLCKPSQKPKLNSIRKLGRPRLYPSIDKEQSNNSSNIPNGYWECSHCKKICKKGDERREHEKIHRKERSIGVICEQCGKGFRHQRILQIHMRVHTGERPYKCQFCPMAFGQSGALNNHERQHTGEKPYKCNYCDKSFCQSGLWKTHELTHTLSELPYGCHICEKRFLRPHNLADHIKTHNFKPHKPIPCPSCPKYFKNMKSLTIHQIFHREEAFQFDCQYCEKKFIKLAAKEKHELIHTQAGQFPYECTDCDRKYAHDTSLSKHRKKCHRTGNSPPPQYKCAYCDRIFLKFKSKEKHEHAHEMGPKSYECNICNNKYAYKHGLKKHQKKKHNIKIKIK